MKYWIIIDLWNLIETFTTESLSPHSFYLNRSFGNDLTRYISKDGELFHNLVLYNNEPISEYAIEVDSDLLDESLITKTESNDVSLYPRTIYFRKGSVRFRFKDEASVKRFIAETRIIFEVKTVEKYSESFFCGEGKVHIAGKIDFNEHLPFELNKYVQADNLFNSIKGGIVSYACGEKNTTTTKNQSLILTLISLKNRVAGLNTAVMIGDENRIDFSPYQIALEKLKIAFEESEFKTNINLPDVLKDILDEIISLSSLRLETIAHQKSPDYASEMAKLERTKEEYKRLLYNLEDSNIREINEELNLIKKKEEENGKREGKKRKYFPKDSPEYRRKLELKKLIEKFKEENEEYKTAYRKYKSIKNTLANSNIGVTQYDAVISSLFTRFSDNINDIIKMIKTDLNQKNGSIDILPTLEFNDNIHITISSISQEEELAYNILIRHIISNPNRKQSSISDSKIIDIVEKTGKTFSELKESNSELGKQILTTLREFWQYKNQKSNTFTIPEHLPVLQAIMSFLIKPRGFDQIERYMLNRGYQLKKYAFLLWGCLVGYASLPKTLTNTLNDQSQAKAIDDYIWHINSSLKEHTSR